MSFPKLQWCTVKVCEWIGNSISPFNGCDCLSMLRLNHITKWHAVMKRNKGEILSSLNSLLDWCSPCRSDFEPTNRIIYFSLVCHMSVMASYIDCLFNTLFKITQKKLSLCHYSDVIMGAIASQITGITIVYFTVCSGADQRKRQSFVSLTFMRGIHRWPVNSLHKGPVTWNMFPFDDVAMWREPTSDGWK